MRVFTGEPGAEHRETLETASHAAAAGGVTTICVMPDAGQTVDRPAMVDFVLRRAPRHGPASASCPSGR